MQETTNLGLMTYEASDPTDWLADFNYNMTKIDEAVGTQNASIATVTATANQANSTATLANTTAENALSTATTANSTANTALSTANSASETATTANSTANTALSTANSASETATTASETASSASETASSASETANSASETANSALTVANSKASINDSTASSSTTYSSNKIDTKINDLKKYTSIQLTAVNGHSDYCVVYKAGHVVTLDFEWDGSLAGVVAFNLPSEYRPNTRVLIVPVSVNQKGEIEMHIETNGEVSFTGGNGLSEGMYGTTTYIAAQY